MSCLEYCNPLFVGINEWNSNKIEKIQRKSHRIICGSDCDSNCPSLLKSRRAEQAKKTFRRMEHPHHILHSLIPARLPRSGKLRIPSVKSSCRLHSFVPYCTCLLNDLLWSKACNFFACVLFCSFNSYPAQSFNNCSFSLFVIALHTVSYTHLTLPTILLV